MGLGLEPVQASPTAFSAISATLDLNSASSMPKSFKVLGMFSFTLYSSIFWQSFFVAAALGLEVGNQGNVAVLRRKES